MQNLISDTACLIRLNKEFLLEAFIKIPCSLIPDVMLEEKALSFSNEAKKLLENCDKIKRFSGNEVVRVQLFRRNHPVLILNDCFALTLAEMIPNCLFMTEDSYLRSVATEYGIKVGDVNSILNIL